MKILHLDDQPATVEWIPTNLAALLGRRKDEYYSVVRNGFVFTFGPQTRKIEYHIVDDLGEFISLSQTASLRILDFHIGTQQNDDRGNLEYFDIFWTAYPGEAREKFSAFVIITKGNRDELLSTILAQIAL